MKNLFVKKNLIDCMCAISNDLRQNNHELPLTCVANASSSRLTCPLHLFRKALVMSVLLLSVCVGNAWGETASVTISTYASTNSWSNGTRYASINLDSHITASANTSNGLYYSANNDWRFYQSQSGKLTLTAATGYKINSFTITFNNSDNGTLSYGGAALTSGTAKSSLNVSSAELVVGASSGTSGKINIREISVTYSASGGGDGVTNYTLVTSAASLSAGDVVVFGASAGKVAGAISGEYLTAQTATISDGVLTAEDALEFTLGGNAGNWTLANGTNTLRATSATALSLSTTGGVSTWTITIGGASSYNATIAPSETYTTGKIQYNSGSPRFKNYTSSQGAIQLYRKVSSEPCSADPTIGTAQLKGSFSLSNFWCSCRV